MSTSAVIPGISRPTHRSNGAFRTLVTVTCVAVLGATGLYVNTQMTQRAAARASDQLAVGEVQRLTAQINQLELEEQWLKDAIRERRVLLGMTRTEVRMAKGDPSIVQRGPSLPDPHRQFGAVENWIYETNGVEGVAFGPTGLVIHAGELDGKPRHGNQIRAGG